MDDEVIFIEDFTGKDLSTSETGVVYRVEAVLYSITEGVKPTYTLRMVQPSPHSGVREMLRGVPWSHIAHVN